MTQEEKQLLLKDLSCRIPYGVIVNVEGNTNAKLESVNWYEEVSVDDGSNDLYTISEVRPYLFPLSSMTEEQQKEANIFDDMDIDILKENLERNHRNKTNIPTATYNYIDWLNAHHFDYRGLIEKGLAIEAPEEMYN